MKEEKWVSVSWVPPPFIMEKKPWWIFWRAPLMIYIGDQPGYWVAVGSSGGRVMCSPDAQTWTEMQGVHR